MNTFSNFLRRVVLALALSTLSSPHPIFAQGSAFTYQGFLTVNGAPANGTNDFEFKLFNAAASGAQQGSTIATNDVGVTNGLFTVTLDFGGAVFTGADRWLDIAVRPGASMGAYTNLVPRQPVTSTPYAIKAGHAMTVDMGTVLNPSFIGTTTTAPLEFFVNNQRAMRIEDNGDGSSDPGSTPDGAPNLIGGSALNSVAAGVVGTVISGGGATNLSGVAKPNTVGSDYATIGGGSGNVIEPAALGAVIAGGQDNQVLSLAGHATISGGQQHRVTAGGGTVGGGNGNVIELGAFDAVVSGGVQNRIRTNSAYAAIGGGAQNTIGTNSPYASILGGYSNGLGDGNSSAVIGGGYANNISSNAIGAAILAGRFNNIGASATDATLAGGSGNTIGAGAFGAVIAGGQNNTITTNGGHGIISGGQQHRVNAGGGIIGGGNGNVIELAAFDAVISGGSGNRINTNSVTAVIGGGAQNTIGTNSPYASILGGYSNDLGDGNSSAVIGGGFDNNISSNAIGAAIFAGGFNNIRSGAGYSVIGGGANHQIQSNAFSATISGGNGNAVGFNAVASTIGGGGANVIHSNAQYAAIPGGRFNQVGASASHAFAAGRRARADHAGAFVWADTTDADFTSTSANQFLIRASGGIGINTNNPGGAALAVNGPASISSSTQTPLAVIGSGTGGTWQNLANTSTDGRNWSFISTGSGNGEGAGNLLFRDTTANAVRMVILTNGNVGIGTTSPTNRLQVIGNVSATTFVTTSDRNAKENFAHVDPREILEKVTALSLSRWTFKEQSDGEHLGPMAQDFKAAFGLGANDTTIATVDADGVALAAIQGLNEKVEAGRQESGVRIQELIERLNHREAEITELKQTVAELKNLMETLLKSGGGQ